MTSYSHQTFICGGYLEVCQSDVLVDLEDDDLQEGTHQHLDGAGLTQQRAERDENCGAGEV